MILLKKISLAEVLNARFSAEFLTRGTLYVASDFRLYWIGCFADSDFSNCIKFFF